MSQHDYDIANAPGASVRADLNAVLSALATLNSGASAPSVTFPHMLWFDESTNILKIRNDANTAWLSMANITTTLYTPYRQGVALGDAATRTIGVGANDQVPDRAAADTRWVQKAGDTMTGGLSISATGPSVTINDNDASPSFGILRFQRNGLTRWQLYKSTTNQDLQISRHDAGGVTLDFPLTIDFATGAITFSAVPTGPGVDPSSGNQLTRKSYVDNRMKYYQSGFVSWTSGGTASFTHGLGATPYLIWPVAHCVTSEHGYTGGSSQVILSAVDDNGGMPLPGTVRSNSTTFTVQYGTPAGGTPIALVNHATTGARVGLTPANWLLRWHAVAFAL